MPFAKFKSRYACRSNFLHYYKVISAIPKNLLKKTETSEQVRKESYSIENGVIQLDEFTQLDLNKAKTCDFYKLLNVKTHTIELQSVTDGPLKME